MPSQKILEQKKEVVKKLSEKIKKATTIIFAEFIGLTVEQDTELRCALRKANIDYSVVKNTLTNLAAKENNLAELEPYFNGSTAMAISTDDLVAPAKVLVEYAKKYDKLKIKVGVVEGKIIKLDEIKFLAELPSREVIISQVLAGLNSPIVGLVNVLNGNIRGLAIVLDSIAKKKQTA